MTATRLNPDKTGNVVDMVADKVAMTIKANSASANVDVTFPRALPSGKSYFAVVTLNEWISVHEAKPVYSIRSISNTGMNVHGSFKTARSADTGVSFGYIAVAY